MGDQILPDVRFPSHATGRTSGCILLGSLVSSGWEVKWTHRPPEELDNRGRCVSHVIDELRIVADARLHFVEMEDVISPSDDVNVESTAAPKQRGKGLTLPSRLSEPPANQDGAGRSHTCPIWLSDTKPSRVMMR